MITAVLLAAGKGARAGFRQNKILQELNGLPVLCYSLSAFAQTNVDEIITVCRKEEETQIKKLLSPYPNARICFGGETRGDSVYNALLETRGEIVLIHDAARPYLSRKIIETCIQSVENYGSGVCALPSSDTAVLAENGSIAFALPRERIYFVQTPQGFYTEKLLFAYECARRDGLKFTDESGIYARYVAPPRLFPGERANQKLTYREDFSLFERVGFGTDTHAFGKKQNHIVLGGVRIPSDSGLIAHSDGDVLIHAVMDALLGAAGLRDIGYYFPDTGERYRNADSMELLRETLSLIGREGFAPQNVSISVLAETPRLSPYIGEIKKNLAAALSLSEDEVGIAAGTNEKLGYVGEGKGITVYAVVLLKSTKAI